MIASTGIGAMGTTSLIAWPTHQKLAWASHGYMTDLEIGGNKMDLEEATRNTRLIQTITSLGLA